MFWTLATTTAATTASDNSAQLWSGVYGAIIGALFSASIAMVIVWRTNKAQKALAADQLAEQRRETARTRRIEAIADLAAISMALQEAHRSGEEAITEASLRAHAAIVRWRISGGDAEMSSSFEEIIDDMTSMYVDLANSKLSSTEKSDFLRKLSPIAGKMKAALYFVADAEDPDKAPRVRSYLKALAKSVGEESQP